MLLLYLCAMPPKEADPEKLFYSIGEVAILFKVNASLIRFWEKEFDIIRPQKNKKGNRLFTREDLANFHLIHHLVKERGFTLQGARQMLKNNRREAEENLDIVKRLQHIRSFLVELRKEL